MQKDPLISALVGALFLGSAAILVLGLRYNHQAGVNRQVQTQLINIQNTRASVVALANDAIEYSKHNPAIDPLLQQAGLKLEGKPAAK